MTELPESKGAYVLIASVAQTKRLAIGRLGEFIIIPGFYAYVGSACGHGGIRARVSHHLESITQPHWHIDYLLGLATPIEVWYTTWKVSSFAGRQSLRLSGWHQHLQYFITGFALGKISLA